MSDYRAVKTFERECQKYNSYLFYQWVAKYIDEPNEYIVSVFTKKDKILDYFGDIPIDGSRPIGLSTIKQWIDLELPIPMDGGKFSSEQLDEMWKSDRNNNV